ncbi:MAG: chromate efflux transporter [Chloroflexi bacterium]|nr:chromate efflux transporter [Chloroflexota bacterium]
MTEATSTSDPNDSNSRLVNLLTIFVVALRLGLTSFGGPIAHIGFFRQEYVENRRWLSERRFSDLVALCHFLPGPTSSQVGIAVGITRGGLLGGVLAWVAFTAPSAALLIAFGFGITEFDNLLEGEWLIGLKIAAVAVVAQALWGMSTTLAPDKTRATVAVLAAVAILLSPLAISIVVVILIAGAYGWWRFRHYVDESPTEDFAYDIPKSAGIAVAVVFVALLVGLPLARFFLDVDVLAIFDGFFRSGSLVFGGGHVVLPTLETEVVNNGWVSTEQFIAGYGASQAIPGPLFTFSAYLGTVMDIGPGGISGALIALVAIFLPSFLLVIAILPFWNQLSRASNFRAAMVAINAAVVGILAAAFFDPVWTSSIKEPKDFALAAAAFGLLMFWKLPSWLVVIICAAAGAGLAIIA